MGRYGYTIHEAPSRNELKNTLREIPLKKTRWMYNTSIFRLKRFILHDGYDPIKE